MREVLAVARRLHHEKPAHYPPTVLQAQRVGAGMVAMLSLVVCSSRPLAPPLRQPPVQTNMQTPTLTDEVRRKLDAEIDKQMQASNLPSVAVSIIVPGEAPYTFVKGKANLDAGRDRRPDEHIRVASYSAEQLLVLTSDETHWQLRDSVWRKF